MDTVPKISQIDRQILIDDTAICRHIDSINFLGMGSNFTGHLEKFDG